MKKRYYILADSHLGGKVGDADSLCQWVRSLDASKSVFISLGDFFHIWAGPSKYHNDIITKVLNCLVDFRSNGGLCYLVVGNRDIFLKEGQGQPLPHLPFDEIALDFLQITTDTGKRLLCTHGDLVNSQDQQYLRWRKIVRSKLFRAFFNLIPAKKVKQIMHDLENKLKGTNQTFRLSFPEEEWQSFIQKTMQTKTFDLLLVGHFHPENLIETQIEQGKALVVPDWYNAHQALQLDESLEYTLIQTDNA